MDGDGGGGKVEQGANTWTALVGRPDGQQGSLTLRPYHLHLLPEGPVVPEAGK